MDANSIGGIDAVPAPVGHGVVSPAQILGEPDATATRVRKTGLVVVHEGEEIRSHPSSQAGLELVDVDANRVIQLSFPVAVAVEVVGEISDRQSEVIIDATLRRLREALESDTALA